MTEYKFTAQVRIHDGRGIILLPFDPADAWGARERYHLTGSVDGMPFRGPLREHGLELGIVLGPAWLRDHPITNAASVEVVLDLEGPQSAALPPDIAAALAGEPAAAEFFDSLPTFYRNNYMRWLESAKRPETRAQRLAELITLLKNKKREK